MTTLSTAVDSTTEPLMPQPPVLAAKIARAMASYPDQTTTHTKSDSLTESYRTWYQRGLFLLEAKHYKRALECFEQAVTLDATQSDVWYARGEVLAALGRYSEALGCFDQSLVLKADSCKALIFRAVVLFHLQQFANVVTCCDQALALQPTDPEAWIFRGSALQRLGRYKEAYASFDKATGTEQRSLWQWLVDLVHPFLRLVESAEVKV